MIAHVRPGACMFRTEKSARSAALAVPYVALVVAANLQLAANHAREATVSRRQETAKQ